jgi:hypothetical protein
MPLKHQKLIDSITLEHFALNLNRHCERSEAIQGGLALHWIASSLRFSQ